MHVPVPAAQVRTCHAQAVTFCVTAFKLVQLQNTARKNKNISATHRLNRILAKAPRSLKHTIAKVGFRSLPDQ